MEEGSTDNKYSNIEVINKTKISNLNFNLYDNIIYTNNILSTDASNTLTLNKSNSTYVIQNVTHNFSSLVDIGLYKKPIKEIRKESQDIFISDNHNLKKNDIVKLINIYRTDPDNLSNFLDLRQSNLQSNDITYKVINSTRDTFTLKSFNNSNSSLNNINNIIKTSNKNIVNSFVQLTTTKSISNENKIVKVNLETNPTDDLGIYYNLIINDDISKLTINTTGNDSFIGHVNIGNNEMIINNKIETSTNKTTLTLQDINLKFSKFEFINIQKNLWYIKANVYNNKIIHKLTYDSTENDYKINGSPINLKHFYKNYLYEFDISDPSLKHYLFIIINRNNLNYSKNIIKFGEMGYPNSVIRIFIDPNETLDETYKIKYKKKLDDVFYTFINLYTIKNPPVYFSGTSTSTTSASTTSAYTTSASTTTASTTSASTTNTVSNTATTGGTGY